MTVAVTAKRLSRPTEQKDDGPGRKRTAKASRTSNDRYRHLLESVQDGVLIMEADTGRIIAVNPFLASMLGYARGTFIGKTLREIKPFRSIEGCTSACAALQRKGTVRCTDLQLTARGGRIVDIDVVGNLYRIGGKRIVQCSISDVTGRKTLERQWLRSVFIVNSAAEFMTLISRNYVYEYANDSYCHALGRSRDEIIGRSVIDIWGEKKFNDIVRKNIDRCLAGNRVADESWVDFPAAGKRYFSIHYYPYSESGEVVTHVVVVSHDITKLKQDAISLQDSHDRLRLAQRASLSGVWDWDLVTDRMSWSEELYELFGLSLSVPATFDTWRGILHPGDRDFTLWRVQTAIDEKKPLSSKYRIVRPDGRKIWISALGRTEYDHDGRPLRMSGICIDITARRKAVEDLRVMEDKYRGIVLNAVEGIYQSTPEGRFLSVNPAMAGILGYNSPEEMMSRITDAGEQLYADPECRDRFKSMIEKYGRVEKFEAEMIRKDGSTTWVSFNTRLVRDRQGRPLCYEGIMEDISKRKMAEDDLRKTGDKLRSLASYLQNVREQERTQIARELHDEFGQIMTGIKIDLSRLDQVLNRLADLPLEAMQRMESLFELTDTAIQFTREIAASLRPSILDDFGITPALSWQTKTFEERTGIACRFSAGQDNVSFSPEISTALFRICQECLTNVARHSGATAVEIVLDRRGDAAYLLVRDNGRGMKEEDASAAGSFGILGMKERVSMLGGEIAFHSVPGEGTEVEVMIPIEEQTS